MYSDLKTKVVIVTGLLNPAGVGSAIAEGLAKSGMNVVCADIDQTHLQETAGERKEIVHAAALLASDKSWYITGQILSVGGGLSVWQGDVRQ